MEPIEDQQLSAVDEGRYELKLEASPRWVRVTFADELIADSKRVKLQHETGHLPVYYFPRDDVRTDLLEQSSRIDESPHKGPATVWSVRVKDRVAEDAAWAYLDPPPEHAELADHIAFYWSKMDRWFEEDEEVFLHPRDPYHRVDVARSSRHVRVELDGVALAETDRPSLLFETSLPTRYYLPKLDVRMDLLQQSDTTTVCPYKGRAIYWDVLINGATHENLVWSYPAPIPECPKIENLLCFFDERVDIVVDGECLERPRSQWSTVISSYG